MTTFASNHTLPPLPIPELQATCAAIPELVAPLVDAQTLAQTHTALEQFTRPGGAGEVLQAALLERKASFSGNSSWLRPLWDEMYTSWRDELPVNMNYFFLFDEKRWSCLARLVLGLASVARQIGNETLPPEESKNGPLAMDQALHCFYTRIPGRTNDSLLRTPLSGPMHIAVVCKGHWFILPLQGDDGEFITPGALDKAFAAIRKEAANLPAAPAIGAITTTKRAESAVLRDLLGEERQNRLSLASIEKALFVVCLDPAHPSPNALAKNLLCGDPASRWFDKSLQIIATEDGKIGANFEHAGCDAGIWVYILSQVDALLPSFSGGEQGGHAPYRTLGWSVSAQAGKQLHALARSFEAVADGIDLGCESFPALSRAQLKSYATSPDAFLQTCFQLAQHQVFGKLRSSYEAVAVRKFAEGRTECARGSSGDALAFALALKSGAEKDKLVELYRQSERTHLARLVRCQRGLGVERHMSGLQAVFQLQGQELGIAEAPALFSDAGWLQLKHDALSTSGIGAPFISYFGFGPTVPDGFGIGYAPNADKAGLIVSCFSASSLSVAQFFAAFEKAEQALGDLLRQDAPQ